MTHAESGLPSLVAHRGNAADFPENTLESLGSAVDLGLQYVEFDVQLTRDLVPVVLHDADLRRVAGRPDCVHDLDWADLRQVPVTEASRFGTKFGDVRAPSLAEVIDSVKRWRDVTAFVEVKRASLRRFGHETVCGRVAEALRPALARCVPISFDLESVRALREMTGARIGWVIERFDDATRAAATASAPDFLFADVEQIPAGATGLWPGPWRWAFYEVRDLATVRRCAELGAHLVETMAVRDLLAAYATVRAP